MEKIKIVHDKIGRTLTVLKYEDTEEGEPGIAVESIVKTGT